MLFSIPLFFLALIRSSSALVVDVSVTYDAAESSLEVPKQPVGDESAGAIYFMTNEQSGNFLVSASIGPDGLLTPKYAISTRGIGGHGKSILSLDPLFSEGSVIVNQKKGLIATVNPGSNTVQLFAVDPLMPYSPRPIGQPASVGGDFPTSASFNSAGDVLCVLSGGVGACVRCFTVDERVGLAPGSTRNLGLNQTTPPTGFPGTVTAVRFTPNDKTVVVIVKGNPNITDDTGVMMSWPLTSARTASMAQNVTLSKLTSIGSIPFSMTNVPGKKAFLSADAGVDVFDYSAGFGEGQVKNKSVTIPGQIATCWSTYSNFSGNFYVADILMSTLTEIHVDDDLTPSVVKQYIPPPGNTGTNEMATATINGQGFLYVLLPSITSIGVMRIDGPGNATFVQTLDFSKSAAGVGLPISPDQMAGMGIFVK